MPFVPDQQSDVPAKPKVVLPSQKKDAVTTSTTTKRKGFFSRVADDASARFERGRAIFDRLNKKEQSAGSTALQTAGEVAGLAGDVIGEGLTSAYRTSAAARSVVEPGTTADVLNKDRESFAKIGESLASTALGKKAIGALQGGLENWNSFKEKEPVAAANFEAMFNVADLATNLTGAGVAKQGAKAAGKTAIEGAETAIKGTADVLREGIDQGIKQVDQLPSVKNVVGEIPIPGAIKETANRMGENISRGVSRAQNAVQEQARIAALPEIERAVIRTGVPERVVQTVKEAPEATKKLFSEMLDRLDNRITKGSTDVRDQAIDVLGKPIVETTKKLAQKTRDVGEQIGEMRKQLRGVEVDATPIRNAIAKEMQNLRLGFNKAGQIVPESGVPADRDVVEVLNDVFEYVGKDDVVDADIVDLLRQSLGKSVNKANAPFSDNATRILKNYRKLLAEVAATADDNYGALLNQYADNIDALKSVTKIMGYKGSIEDIADRTLKAGQIANRTLGKAPDAAVEVIEKLVERAAAEGIKMDTDIFQLANFARELDDLIGPTAPSGLRGEVQSATEGAIGRLGTPGKAVEGLMKFGVAEGKDRLDALRRLIGQKVEDVASVSDMTDVGTQGMKDLAAVVELKNAKKLTGIELSQVIRLSEATNSFSEFLKRVEADRILKGKKESLADILPTYEAIKLNQAQRVGGDIMPSLPEIDEEMSDLLVELASESSTFTQFVKKIEADESLAGFSGTESQMEDLWSKYRKSEFNEEAAAKSANNSLDIADSPLNQASKNVRNAISEAISDIQNGYDIEDVVDRLDGISSSLKKNADKSVLSTAMSVISDIPGNDYDLEDVYGMIERAVDGASFGKKQASLPSATKAQTPLKLDKEGAELAVRDIQYGIGTIAEAIDIEELLDEAGNKLAKQVLKKDLRVAGTDIGKEAGKAVPLLQAIQRVGTNSLRTFDGDALRNINAAIKDIIYPIADTTTDGSVASNLRKIIKKIEDSEDEILLTSDQLEQIISSIKNAGSGKSTTPKSLGRGLRSLDPDERKDILSQISVDAEMGIGTIAEAIEIEQPFSEAVQKEVTKILTKAPKGTSGKFSLREMSSDSARLLEIIKAEGFGALRTMDGDLVRAVNDGIERLLRPVIEFSNDTDAVKQLKAVVKKIKDSESDVILNDKQLDTVIKALNDLYKIDE